MRFLLYKTTIINIPGILSVTITVRPEWSASIDSANEKNFKLHFVFSKAKIWQSYNQNSIHMDWACGIASKWRRQRYPEKQKFIVKNN